MASCYKLINSIIEKYPEIGECFLESSLIDDSLLTMSFVEFKQILKEYSPRQRCEVWQIIQQQYEVTCDTPPISPTAAVTSFIEQQTVKLTDTCPEKVTVCAPHSTFYKDKELMNTESLTEQQSVGHKDTPPEKVTVPAPQFTLYRDKELMNTERAGGLNKSQISRLIRTTITNMEAELFTRKPHQVELEEMAKSLIVVYPSLKDVKGTHLHIYQKLKKRLYNHSATTKSFTDERAKKRKKLIQINVDTSPEKNKMDYTERSSKLIKFDIESTKKEQSSSRAEAEHEQSSSRAETEYEPLSLQAEAEYEQSSSQAEESNTKIQRCKEPEIARFHELLDKEMVKPKPNEAKIKLYLDKTINSRRTFLSTIKEGRAKVFLKKYPVFRNHIQIVEEVRRLREHKDQYFEEEPHRENFISSCVDNFKNYLNDIIFFGLAIKNLPSPKAITIDAKLIYLLQNLHKIFESSNRKKKKEKPAEIMYEVEDHEDPEKKRAKMITTGPVLFVAKSNISLLVGRNVFFNISRQKIPEAFVAFLASFYVLDLDYPKGKEIALTIMQWLIFNDRTAPKDIIEESSEVFKTFLAFKDE